MRGPQLTLVGGVVVLVVAAGCSFDSSAQPDLPPLASPGADAAATAPDVDSGNEANDPDELDAGSPPAPESGLGLLVSDWVPEAPAIDGELDDLWEGRLIGFSLAGAMDTAQVHPSYSFDATVRFASVHTDDDAFFIFDIQDEMVVSDFIPPASDDDAIYLFLDSKGDRDGPYRDDDHWFRLSSAGTYGSYGPTREDLSDYSVEITGGGYRIELAMPLELFESNDVGIDIALSDNDLLGTLQSDAIGIWYVDDRPRCEDCCDGGDAPYCDTTFFGSLLFMPE